MGEPTERVSMRQQIANLKTDHVKLLLRPISPPSIWCAKMLNCNGATEGLLIAVLSAHAMGFSSSLGMLRA